MSLRLTMACAMSLLTASGAAAQITGVVTDSTADVALTPGSRPGGNFHFEGVNIDGTNNDRSPSGASYNSRSEVDGPEILFVNGNATSGSYASATTLTILDVTFRNDGTDPVDAILRSTLLPAGFGMFVGSAACATGPVTSCSEAVGGPGFADFPNAPNNFGPLALASFAFNVQLGEQSLFSLTGSLALVFDPTVGRNVIVTNIRDAASVLSGFTQVTAADDPTGLAFVWDATEIDLALGTIDAGESRVLTYTTSATTFTRSFGTGGCGLVAFSEFGDPIGRGGSIPPPTFARGAATDPCINPSGGLALQRPSLFRFPVPTFENGVLSVLVDSTVPEPATWAMMITGFGLAGAAQRRRRAVIA